MKAEKKLAKFGILYTLAASIQKGVGFLVFMLLASVVSVDDYASFGINYALFTVVSVLTGSGISVAVVGLLGKYKSEEDRKSLFQAASTVFLILSLCSLIIITPIQLFVYKLDLFYFLDIGIVILSSITTSFYIMQSILVQYNESHIESIILSFVPQFLGYVLGFCFVLYFKTSISFFWGIFISQLMSMFIFRLKNVNFYGISRNKELIITLLKRIIPYTLIAIIAWFLGYGNTYIIDYLFEAKHVAIYLFLYTISSILQLVATSMNQAWSPHFYKLYNEIEVGDLEKKYKKFTFFQGLILGAVGLIILLLTPFIAQFEPSLSVYVNSTDKLVYLFAGYVVAIPWWHTQNYFFITDKSSELLNITFISGIIGFSFWLASMYLFGENGIYLGFFINMLVRSLIIYLIARRKWIINSDYEGVLIGNGLLLLAFLF